MNAADGLNPLERWLADIADDLLEAGSGTDSGDAPDAFDRNPWRDVEVATVVLTGDQLEFLNSLDRLPGLGERELVFDHWQQSGADSEGEGSNPVDPPDVFET